MVLTMVNYGKNPTKPCFIKLVGGWPTPLKNMKVKWEGLFPYTMENEKCLKPPSSYSIGCDRGGMNTILMEFVLWYNMIYNYRGRIDVTMMELRQMRV